MSAPFFAVKAENTDAIVLRNGPIVNICAIDRSGGKKFVGVRCSLRNAKL